VGKTPKIYNTYLIIYIIKWPASESASVKKAEDGHFILKDYSKDLNYLQIKIFLVLIKFNAIFCKDKEVIVSTVISTYL